MEQRRSRKGGSVWRLWSKCFFPILFIAVTVSLLRRRGKIPLDLTLTQIISDHSSSSDFLTSRFLQRDDKSYRETLEYDFYRDDCPNAEGIVRNSMARIFSQDPAVSSALLRLMFHDCFVKGCDASVFLDDSGGNKSHPPEKFAPPNRSLKGFDRIDMIKEEVEYQCPGTVSCADILVLATRDGIVLAGGPFYPLLTGRRDSTESYYAESLSEIPSPDDNIGRILQLFNIKGFNERETVTLFGGHSIGSIACEFIEPRLHNFSGTGHPDPTVGPNFLNELRKKCDHQSKRSISGLTSTSISSRGGFNSHYFRTLLRGRGLLHADQQLMANETTADFVMGYAFDGGSTFRMDFARAMMKMSNLGVLTGRQGQVRTNCSFPSP